jgi:hypothetical protein
MQTRFQIREVDVSKGYCLLVTDKNHLQIMFGFDHLEAQMQRLEQFLVYSDDARREIATVNLLVARNIPVTFAQPVSTVISELEPAPKETKPPPVEPEIRKATPVYPKAEKALPYSPGVKKFRSSPPPLPVRKAIPLQRFNQENNANG